VETGLQEEDNARGPTQPLGTRTSTGEDFPFRGGVRYGCLGGERKPRKKKYVCDHPITQGFGGKKKEGGSINKEKDNLKHGNTLEAESITPINPAKFNDSFVLVMGTVLTDAGKSGN